MRLLPIGLYLLATLGTSASCDTQRPPSAEQVSGGLSIRLSSNDVSVQPGASVSLTIKVKTTMALSGPAQLSLSYPDGSALPQGIGFAFEPSSLTVPTGSEVQAQLRISADASIKISDYALLVTVASAGREASIPVLVRISDVGPQWARQIGTTGTDTAVAMTTDSQGNLYVAINSTGSVDGKSNQGDYDGYLLSYSPAGQLRWTAQIASSKTDYITGLSVDRDDTLWVSGYTFGVLPSQTSPGRTDGFVARFAQTGQRLWLRQFGTTEIDKLTGISVSAQGVATVVGNTEGSYGSGTNAGLTDIWIAQLASDGKELSSLQIGSDQGDTANAVAVDANQVSFVVGNTEGILPTGNALGLQDGFVLTVLPTGKLGWLRHVGSSGNDELLAATTDDSGGVWVAGSTRGTLPGQVSMGGQDGILVRFVSDGSRTVTRQLGTSYLDTIQSLAWVSGKLYSVGTTRGAFADQDARGSYDFFVGRHGSDGSLAWVSQNGTEQSDTAAAITGRGNQLFVAATTFGAFDNLLAIGDSDGFIQSLRVY
ncbi:MAG: SBBP repeat-containing protein [Polyangia bacterium]